MSLTDNLKSVPLSKLIDDLRTTAREAGSLDLPYIQYVLDEMERRLETVRTAAAIAGLSSFLKDTEIVNLLDAVVVGDPSVGGESGGSKE